MQSTVTTPKLYELTDSYIHLANRHFAIMEEIEESEGEVTEAQSGALDRIAEDLGKLLEESDVKIVKIMQMCEQRNMEVVVLKAEEQRLGELAKDISSRRKRLEKSNQFFQSYCAQAMRIMDVKKVTDGTNVVSLRKSERTEIVDMSRIARAYINRVSLDRSENTGAWVELLTNIESNQDTIFTMQADKTMIKKAIKSGTAIDGAEIKEHYTAKLA